MGGLFTGGVALIVIFTVVMLLQREGLALSHAWYFKIVVTLLTPAGGVY